MRIYSVILIIFMARVALCQEKRQKRLVCQMVDDDSKQPIQLDGGGEGLKVVPFSLSLEKDKIDSTLSNILENLPVVNSPDEIRPVQVQTPTQNVSVTCDVVSSDFENKIKGLEDKIAKLTEAVEGLEGNAVCPGGVTYLDRCFRLMEIRGKTFSQPKAEDLCNFNGGVLADLDSPLVYTTVATYIHRKFSDPKYGNKTVLVAWTGMSYEIPTIGVMTGPFSMPTPIANQTNERLEALNKILSWYPGFPKEKLTHDQIALQFRYTGRERKQIAKVGAINIPKRRRFIPLCQFHMQDWQKPDSVSARLFRFNF